MSTDSRRRVLFLVTTPVSESLDWVLYKIDSATRESPPPTQEVDWDDTSDPITSISTIKPTLSFTRHLALGAMDKEDWDDTSLTNLQRFSKAYFWEHRGSSNEPRQGNGWGEKEIRSIEAIQFLGWTEKPNEIITEEYCSALLEGWAYLPVWWNCQSFATRLAFLVVEQQTFRDLIASLAQQFHTQIVKWVTTHRGQICENVFLSSWCTGLGSWIGAAVSTVVFPPAGAFFVAGFVGSWSVGMATAATAITYQVVDGKRDKKFRENMEQLEKKFPLLRQLHAYLHPELGTAG